MVIIRLFFFQLYLHMIFPEGFVKKAMQLGLKPEFAIFCGYHEDDWRAKKDPEWFLKQAPPDFVQDFVMEYSLILMRLIKRKLMDEGKVRHDEEYGYVIIEDEQQEATEQTRPEAPEAEAEHIEQKTAEQEE